MHNRVEPGAAPRARHIQGLDGLRAVAAVAVVAYHVQFLARAGTGPVPTVAAAGWIGVDLFFAISGFVLFIPYARAAFGGRTVDLRRFYAHRVKRIVPAYWFNLFVLVCLVSPGLITTSRGLLTILANATFTAEYFSLPSVNSVYWSLYCELAFYLVLPVMARVFVAGRWVVGLPLAVAVGWAYRFAVVSANPDVDNYFGLIMRFPGVIDQFAFGMVAAALWVRYELEPERVPRWVTGGLSVVGITGLATVAWAIHRRIGLASFWSADGAWGTVTLASLRPTLSAFSAMIIFGVCFHAGPLRRLLELRPVRYLGMVSYGVYLWHLPLIKAISGAVDAVGRSSLYFVAATGVVLVVSLVWAALSYHLLEERFIRGRTASTVADRAAPTPDLVAPP